MRKKAEKRRTRLIIVMGLIFLIIVMTFIFMLIKKTDINQEDVRKAEFAGSWYPANKENLESSINEYLNNSDKFNFDGRVKAVIVPHAGYVYSGKIASSAFKQLDEKYETVFILGPSHQYPLVNISVSNFKYYSTPLGEIKVSKKAKEMEEREEIISNIEEAHEKEHSIEIELPFLQTQIQEFEIVPLTVGLTNTSEFKDILIRYVDENDLIVVSADLSHYHEYNEALILDSYSLNKIIELDSEGIMNAEIDAPWAVSSLLKIAKEKSWKPYIISYANSGDITGDKTSVVGYSAIVFIETFSEENKEYMLNLARDSAEEYLKDEKRLNVKEDEIPEKLKEKKGCFVTFTKEGQLRGCVGYITPEKPLYECIIENSINAATNDPRFSPINPSEIEEVVIDISILTVPYLFEHNSSEELLSKLESGKYGVVLRRGNHQSTFLPSVWEFIPNTQDFLGNLCIKGEMESDCWKDKDTEVYLYTAEDFSE